MIKASCSSAVSPKSFICQCGRNHNRNGFGEVKRRASPDSGNMDYVRNARGLDTQMTDARAVVTNMTYDNAGRNLTKTFPAENVTFTYDALTPATNKGKGRLTGMVHEGGTITRQYDVRGNITRDARVITASGATARNVDYLYDTSDLVTRITYPSGRQVQFTRDTMGRISQVKTKKTAAELSRLLEAANCVCDQTGARPELLVLRCALHGDSRKNLRLFHTTSPKQLKELAGMPGFEPGNGGIKIRCLTTWLHPNTARANHTDLQQRPGATARNIVSPPGPGNARTPPAALRPAYL